MSRYGYVTLGGYGPRSLRNWRAVRRCYIILFYTWPLIVLAGLLYAFFPAPYTPEPRPAAAIAAERLELAAVDARIAARRAAEARLSPEAKKFLTTHP